MVAASGVLLCRTAELARTNEKNLRIKRALRTWQSTQDAGSRR
jgi:hypothetical protein